MSFTNKHWIHFPSTRLHIIRPTEEDAGEIVKRFNQRTGPKPPHDQDQTFATYLRTFFTSNWIDDHNKIRNTEELDTYVQRMITSLPDEQITGHVNLNLNRAQRTEVITRIFVLLEALFFALKARQTIETHIQELNKRPSSQDLESERSKRQKLEEDLRNSQTQLSLGETALKENQEFRAKIENLESFLTELFNTLNQEDIRTGLAQTKGATLALTKVKEYLVSIFKTSDLPTINKTLISWQNTKNKQEKQLKQYRDDEEVWEDAALQTFGPKNDETPWTAQESLLHGTQVYRAFKQAQEDLKHSRNQAKEREETIASLTKENNWWYRIGDLISPEEDVQVDPTSIYAYVEGLQQRASLSNWQRILSDKGIHPQTDIVDLQVQFRYAVDKWLSYQETLEAAAKSLNIQNPTPDQLRLSVQELVNEYDKLSQQPTTMAPSTGTGTTHVYLNTMDMETLRAYYDDLIQNRGHRQSNMPMDDEEELRAVIRGMLDNPPTPPITDQHPVQLAQTLGRAATSTWQQSMAQVTLLVNQWLAGRGQDLAEQPNQPCNHPLALSRRIAYPDGTSWEDSLTEVARLLRLSAPTGPPGQPTPTETTEGGSSKFTFPSNPPTFSSVKEQQWEEYSQALDFWACGLEDIIKPHHCKAAIFQVLAFWKGQKLLEYAHTAGAASLVKPTWKETYQALIAWGDARFISVAYWTVRTARWENPQSYFKASDYESGEIFYLAFDVLVLGYTRACQRSHKDPPTDRMVTNKFVTLLPAAIRDVALLNLPAINPDAEFETSHYRKYHNYICAAWKTVSVTTPVIVKEAVPLAQIKRTWEELDTEDDEPTIRATKRQNTGCPDWKDAPKHLMGRITHRPYMVPAEVTAAKQRHDACLRARVCAKCRQPRSAHTPQDTFMEITPWKDLDPALRTTTTEDQQ
jgi:hypothetical protein